MTKQTGKRGYFNRGGLHVEILEYTEYARTANQAKLGTLEYSGVNQAITV